ncbi:TonB-dependent receptor [Kordiimonas gwangyangensis]|uniref:TonB-dependent receptor n=1 Tax=Kordiimonas gwangyangensis TaxID=288022 RepID=UPI000372DC66|nr:TonB-dependent receptor [Kordiimonas gwangyangensis]
MALKKNRIIAGGILASLLSGHVSAAELAGLNTLVQFEVPQKPLSQSLIEFTDLTGLALVFDSRLVAGKMSPELSGEYSGQVALDLLLEGSGLRVVNVGGDTLAIVPQKIRRAVAEKVARQEAIAAPIEPIAISASTVVDELLIVGTRTINPPYFKFKPSIALEGTRIQFGGTINVSDYLFQLPAMLSDVTSANTTLFGTPAGLNLADLRGVGPERTMVLVNGRRFIPTYGGNQALYGVDLNSIPAALVERVEIIGGGATTSFGGEAVSGVVNFKLRDNFEGWSAAFQTGLTGRGDREEIVASLTYGTKFADGRGSLVASITLDDQAGLNLGDRDITANPSGFAKGGKQVSPGTPGAVFRPGYGGSSLGGRGAFGSVITANGNEVDLGQAYIFSEEGTSIQPFEGRLDQLYNYATDQTLLTPLERVFGTVNWKYDFEGGERLVFENSFASTAIASSLAPMPLFHTSGLVLGLDDTIMVPLTNPYVPDDVRSIVQDIPGAEGIVLQRRIVELGPRRTEIERRTFRSMIGLQGTMAPEWTYDAYYQYGRSQVREERSGLLDLLNYQAALDPDRCANVQGCSVINPFGSEGFTIGDLKFLTAPNAVRRLHADQHIVSLAFAGPIEFLTDEAARVSFGTEYRFEGLEDEPDQLLNTRPVSGSLNFPGSSGSFGALDFYGDITLPLLSDLPGVEELTATGGVRLSEVSTVGTVVNWHVGGIWSPYGGLSFRASFQSGRRAPNIAELYSAGPSTFGFYTDPCVFTDLTSETVRENCTAAGRLSAGGGLEYNPSPIESLIFGSPNLREEKSSNFTLGVVFDTEEMNGYFPGRLRIGADAYRMVIDDYIVPVDASRVLADCYESENLSHAFCGQSASTRKLMIQRDPSTGRLISVESTYINQGRETLEGLDIDLQYVADLRDDGLFGIIDEFSFVGRYTLNHRVDWQPEPGGETLDYLGTAKFPRHRFQFGISLGMGDVTVDWDTRYRSGVVSSYEALQAIGRLTQDGDIPELHINEIWYHDVSARVRIHGNATLYGGVRNLFDAMPSRVFGGSVSDTFPEYYDIVGRRFYAGVVIDF